MSRLRHSLIFAFGFLLTTNPGLAMPIPGDIVINEIMQNPTAVGDSQGEWFELFNSTALDIDIDGWILKDDDTDSHTLNHGGPLLVPAMGYLVLGRNDDVTTNGGVHVDYEYSGIILANGNDELVLLDGLLEIDRVAWDDGNTFPDPNGASMELINPWLDNAIGAHWQIASIAFGAGDRATPGAENGNLRPSAVSEPVTVLLLGLALTGSGYQRKLRP